MDVLTSELSVSDPCSLSEQIPIISEELYLKTEKSRAWLSLGVM